MVLVSLLLLLVAQITQLEGCLPMEPYSRQSRANTLDSKPYTSVSSRNTIVTLNEGELSSVRPNLYATKGQILYGRLMVPWSTEESWTLEVLAYWSGEFYSTPLWLYIKRAGLPSTTDFDKTGVSFVSRKYSRIRVYEARPGPYFVMVEALQDIRNVTLEVNVFGEEKHKELTRSQSWRTYSIP